MPDVRSDFEKTAGDLTKIAQDTAYVAVGLGIMGFQKAQVRRREILDQIERQRAMIERQRAIFQALGEARKDFAMAVKAIDATVGRVIDRLDASFEPVAGQLPESAQAVVQQAREVRDQLRGYFTSLAA